MELVNGRPEDTAGRLEKEIRTYDFLDSLGVAYQRIDHEAAMTMEACEEIDKMLDATICKNLFLCNRQETSFYLLMIPGDKKFKTKELSSQIGSAVLVGTEQEVLFEEEVTIDRKDWFVGHTKEYVKIAVPAEENLANQLQMVKVSAERAGDLLAGEVR